MLVSVHRKRVMKYPYTTITPHLISFSSRKYCTNDTSMPNKGTTENSLNLTHWDSNPQSFVLEAIEIHVLTALKRISFNQ